MWARNGVFSSRCPKSVITAETLYFLEQFTCWKECGGGGLWHMEAKAADAVMALEEAWQMEKRRGEK